MFLLYYNKSDGSKNWIMARDKESLNTFVDENKEDISDYCITVNENEYERMMNKIEIYEKQMDSVKDYINRIFERR